jgi:hypothetical protein
MFHAYLTLYCVELLISSEVENRQSPLPSLPPLHDDPVELVDCADNWANAVRQNSKPIARATNDA